MKYVERNFFFFFLFDWKFPRGREIEVSVFFSVRTLNYGHFVI